MHGPMYPGDRGRGDVVKRDRPNNRVSSQLIRESIIYSSPRHHLSLFFQVKSRR